MGIGHYLKSVSPLFLIVFCIALVLPARAYSDDPAGFASVSGTVRDQITNLPISGAKVKLHCGETWQETVTSSTGSYEFPQVPIYLIGHFYRGFAQILVLAEKYRTGLALAFLLPGRSYTINFSLDTRFKYPVLKGTVTDSVTASGIPNAEVVAVHGDEQYRATTDGQGNYIMRIENRGVGHYAVTASAQGYGTSDPQSLKTFPLHTYTMDFTLTKATLGVSVSPDTWNIGQIPPGSVVMMNDNDKITVLNVGSVATTYSLRVINPPGWQDSQSAAGPNTYVLDAAFSQDKSAIIWDEGRHALSMAPTACSETKFAGDQTGVNVAPAEARTLWLQFKAPAQSSVASEQNIEVIITAQTP